MWVRCRSRSGRFFTAKHQGETHACRGMSCAHLHNDAGALIRARRFREIGRSVRSVMRRRIVDLFDLHVRSSTCQKRGQVL